MGAVSTKESPAAPRRFVVLSVVDRGPAPSTEPIMIAPPTEPIVLVPRPRAPQPASGPTRRITSRLSRPVFGLAGQVLNAGTNVVTAYVASLLLAPEGFGSFVLAFAAVAMVLSCGRGLLGSTIVVHLPTLPEVLRRPLVRSGVGFTLIVGVAVSVVFGSIGGILLWFAPWITAMLVQDLGRFAFLAEARAGAALLLDVIWAVVQGLVVVGWLLVGGSVGVGVLATAWGLGALAGAVLYLVMARMYPTGPMPWLRATRDVAGWFTAVAALGAAELYAVLLLATTLLGSTEAGGLRAVQLLAYQPAMVVSGALLVMLTPDTVHARLSRTALVAVVRRMLLLLSPLLLGLGLVAVLATPLMALLFGKYTGFAPLVVPIALQACATVLCVPATVVLRALRRGAAVFVTQSLRLLLLAGGAAAGSLLAGTPGLAWGLAAGVALSTVQTSVQALQTARQAVPA